MNANDLIKFMDRGYAEGATDNVSLNWQPDLGKAAKEPKEDVLAFYLATWVEGGAEKGLLDSSNVQVMSELIMELQLAMTDLEALAKEAEQMIRTELTLSFFTALREKPQQVNEAKIRGWLDWQPDCDDAAVRDEVCTMVLRELEEASATMLASGHLTPELLQVNPGQPPQILIDKILAGLLERQAASYGKKTGTPIAPVATVNPPETKI